MLDPPRTQTPIKPIRTPQPKHVRTLPRPPTPTPTDGVQVAIAAALIIAAVCATGCLGVTCGKCWLKRQREKAIAEKEERKKLQPANEYDEPGRPGKSEWMDRCAC